MDDQVTTRQTCSWPVTTCMQIFFGSYVTCSYMTRDELPRLL